MYQYRFKDTQSLLGEKVFKFFAFVIGGFTSPHGVMSIKVAHDKERVGHWSANILGVLLC